MDSIFEQPRTTPKQTPIHQNFKAPLVPDASLILQNQPKTKTLPIPPHQQSYNAWKLRNAPNLDAGDSFVTTQKKSDKENRFQNYADYQFYNQKKEGSNTSILKKQVRFERPPQPTTTVVVKSPNFSALLKNQNDENVKNNKTKRDKNERKCMRPDDTRSNENMNETPVVFKRYMAPLRNLNKTDVESNSPEVLKPEKPVSPRYVPNSNPGFSNPLMSLKPIIPQQGENVNYDNYPVRNKQLDLSIHDGINKNDHCFRMQNIRQTINEVNEGIKSKGNSHPGLNHEPHDYVRKYNLVEANDSFMNYKPQQMIVNQFSVSDKKVEERPLSQRILQNIPNGIDIYNSQNGLYNEILQDQPSSGNNQNMKNLPQNNNSQNRENCSQNIQNDSRNQNLQNNSQDNNQQNIPQNLQSNPQSESQNDSKNSDDSKCSCNCKNKSNEKDPTVTELLSIVKMQNEQLNILQNQVQMLIKMNEKKNKRESLEHLLKTDDRIMKHKEETDSDFCEDIKKKQMIKPKRIINHNNKKVTNQIESKRKNKRIPSKDVAVYTDQQVRSNEEVCRRITKEHYASKQMKNDKISVGIMTSFQVSLSSPYQRYESTESTSSTEDYHKKYEPVKAQHKNHTNKPIKVFTDTWHDKINIPNDIIDNNGHVMNNKDCKSFDSDGDESLDESEEIGLDGSVEVEEPPLSPNNTVHVDMQDYDSDSDDESSSADSGWTFYDNILGKVNNILENSPVPNERKATDCTFEQIKQQAIQNLRQIGNEEFGNVNPSDVSFHVKQLLMKYMSDEELTNIARTNRRNKKVSAINQNKILDITTLKKQPKLL